MRQSPHVLIVGAGLGGLALARGLQRRGITADVYERASGPDDALAGYGIHLDGNGWAALTQCLEPADIEKLDMIASHAGSVLSFRDEQLNRLAEVDAAVMAHRDTALTERCGIGRMALRALLLEGAQEIHWNKTFSRYAEDENGVTVFFEDGSEARCDVLVGADASNSRIRRQRLPGLDREDLGVVAIAGRYPVDANSKKVLPSCLRDGSLNNIVPAGHGWMFASAWLLGDRQSSWPGENSDYVVWAYVIDSARMPTAIEPLSGTALRDHVLQMAADWSPALRSVIGDSDPGSISAMALKSMPHLAPWPSSRVTLIGDAIHNMTPWRGSVRTLHCATLRNCPRALPRTTMSLLRSRPTKRRCAHTPILRWRFHGKTRVEPPRGRRSDDGCFAVSSGQRKPHRPSNI